jgi:hypothetical protein
MPPPQKIPIKDVTKAQIIKTIKAKGCDMLTEKLDGTETKAEIVEYLKACKCKVLKKHFDLE